MLTLIIGMLLAVMSIVTVITLHDKIEEMEYINENVIGVLLEINERLDDAQERLKQTEDTIADLLKTSEEYK